MLKANLNKNNLKLFIFAILIGVFSVIFAKSVDWAFAIFLKLTPILHYWLLLYIPCGFLVITFLVTRYFPEAAGSGIPQALSIGKVTSDTKLKILFYPRLIISKYITIVAGTLFGATIGREGPTIQIGATILSFSAKHLTINQRKTLLKIGAAAGLAAAFNTPLGGIVFALEELFKGKTLKLSLLKIAVIATSGIVTITCLGNTSYFGRVERGLLFYNLGKITLPIIFIGVLSGLLAFIFSKAIYYATLSRNSFLNKFRIEHPLINSCICGFLVAIVGLVSHNLSFGNGYAESILALSNQEHLPKLYVLYKMAGSILSTSSGVPGGYFATSLSIGNGVGSLIHGILQIDIPLQQYYLLGMVAFLAAITQAPITAITMVLQITSSQIFTLPLMITALISTFIASLLGKSIYHYQINNLIIINK